MSANVQETIVAVAGVVAGAVVLWRVVRALRPSSKSQPACDNCAVGEQAPADDGRLNTDAR